MSGDVRMTRSRAKRQLASQLEESGAGDMDTTSNISENELGKNLNGSTLSSSTAATDSSPAAEEGPRLSASSSSESVANPSAGSKMKEESDTLVLWRRPLTVLHYASVEAIITLGDWARYLISQTAVLVLIGGLIGLYILLHTVPGSHTDSVLHIEKYLAWCLWWVGLGILSSVGLGTGLHTFILYLGPHIAAVTMAAYECGTLDFPEPPYPNTIQCPEAVDGEGSAASLVEVGVWAIIAKVRIEAFCWGMGTAIGELPPYFMARAARLSGGEPGEDTEEFLELQEKLKNPEKMTRFERAKYGIQQLVERVGFFGILAAASIPNPLFDLAGITCGHFLVPFWTFFGATLIGKAVIKMHIQKVFVILAFNKELFEGAVSLLVQIPVLGARLEGPVRQLLAQQREKLHSRGEGQQGGSVISTIFEVFVLSMVAYFVVSIINSLAQSYKKRLEKEKRID